MQTMLFNFGQSCINLLTGLGNVDCGKHVFLPAPDFFARHNITHFSVRSLQALSPAPQLKLGPDIVDVLNFQDAVREKAHVELPFFHGHAVCLAGDEMQLKAGLSYSRNTHIAVGLADQCVKGEELCHWIDHSDEAIAFLHKSPFAAQTLEFHLSSVDGHLTAWDLLHGSWQR